MTTRTEADRIHDMAEFFRSEVGPVQRAEGAAKVAEELSRRGMKEAAAVAFSVAANMLQGQRTAEKLFDVQWEGCEPEQYDLWSIVEPNREGDPALCEWAMQAKVGESYTSGGGASPAVTTTRVA